MLAIKHQMTTETQETDTAKLELYKLIGEGYKAMQEGRVTPLDEVRKEIEKRRRERG